MALIQIDFFAYSLKRVVPVKVIIPNDSELIPSKNRMTETGKMQSLYLLHNYTGNCNDWVYKTTIQEYARKHKLAVIMPSGDNSFYLDDENKSEYFGEYIGIELVEYIRNMFSLSPLREDTFIGGCSMGGYGALRNGLKYSDTFSKIMCFSGAFIQLKIIENGGIASDDLITSAAYKNRIFGDLSKLEQSDKNPVYISEQLINEGKNIPDILMTCGKDDNLISLNRKMIEQLKKIGIKIKYIEDKGAHNWEYWNRHLEEAIIWATKNQNK